MLSDKDKKLIGGSDAPAIVGISKYRNAHDVFARIVLGQDDTAETKVQRRGKLLQPVCEQLYIDETGATVEHASTIYGKPKPFLRANLDGISVVDGQKRVVEYKTASIHIAHEWGETPEDTPIDYQAQCQFYMGVTGLPSAHLVVLLGGDDLKTYTIESDREAQGILFEACEKFWKDHILTKRPPAIDASDSCSKLLIQRFSPNASFIQAPAEAEEWASRYLAARHVIDTAEAQKKEALNHLLKLAEGAKRMGGNGWLMTMVERKATYEIVWEALWREELSKRFTADEQMALLARFKQEKKGFAYPMVKEKERKAA